MIVKTLLGIFGVLRSNDNPWQLALGFALGTMLGLIPAKSILGLVILILLYLLNVNMGFALMTAALYKVFGAFASPIFHDIGRYLLVSKIDLASLWTSLFNMPIIPWTHFNNTVVLGSVVVSVCLVVPHYFFMFSLIRRYQLQWRGHLEERLQRYKVIKILQGANWFKTLMGWAHKLEAWYQKHKK